MEGHSVRSVSLDWSSEDNTEASDHPHPHPLDMESHSSDMPSASASHSRFSDAGLPLSEDESAGSFTSSGSSRGDDWFPATDRPSPRNNSNSSNNNDMANYAADMLPPMSPQMWASYSRSTQRNSALHRNTNNQSHQYSESAGLLWNTGTRSNMYQRRNSSNFPTSMIGTGSVRPRAQTWSNQTSGNHRNHNNGPFLVPSTSSNSTPIRSNHNRQAAPTFHPYASPTREDNLVFPTLHAPTNNNNNSNNNSLELDESYFPRQLQQLAPRLSLSTTQQLFDEDDPLEVDIESDITTDEETASLTCTDTTLSGGSEDDLIGLYTRTPPQLPFRRLESSSSYNHNNNNNNNNAYYPMALRPHSRFGKLLRVSLVMSCYILMFVHPSSRISPSHQFQNHVESVHSQQAPENDSSTSTTTSPTPKHNEPELPLPGHGREIEFPLFQGKHQTSQIQAPPHIPRAAAKQKTPVKRRPSLSHANGGGIMPVFGSKPHELHDPLLDSPPSSLLSSSSLLSTSTASSFSNSGVERFVLPSESSEDTLGGGAASRTTAHNTGETTKEHHHTQHYKNDHSSFFFWSDCLWWLAFAVTLFGILYLTLMESSCSPTITTTTTTTMTLRQHCQHRYLCARMYITTMVVRVLRRNSSPNNNQNSHHAE